MSEQEQILSVESKTTQIGRLEMVHQTQSNPTGSELITGEDQVVSSDYKITPVVDPLTGIYIDESGEEWGGNSVLGATDMRFLSRRKESLRILSTYVRGKPTNLYNLADAQKVLYERDGLPKASREAGIYTDENGVKRGSAKAPSAELKGLIVSNRESVMSGDTKEQLGLIHKFIYEKVDFDLLHQFELPIHEKYRQNHIAAPSYRYYLGYRSMPEEKNKDGITKEMQHLTVRLPSEPDPDKDKFVIASPKTFSTSLGKNYYWIDFYDQTVDEEQTRIDSCRLDPSTEAGKVSYVAWKGIEQQLFVDYFNNQEGIAFSDLIPFKIKLPATKKYYLAAVTGLTVDLAENSKFKDGDDLLFVPSKDDRYEWVDIFQQVTVGDNEILEKVLSYRFQRDKKEFGLRGWYGTGKQRLLDYLSGEQIAVEDLLPFQSQIDSNGIAHIGVVGGKKKSFHFSIVLKGKKVKMIPMGDKSGRYQWIDVYEENNDGNVTEGDAINTARIIDGNIVQGGWYGYERQMLKDYIESKINIDDIKGVKLRVGKSSHIHLWKDQGRKTYLMLSRYFPVSEGDEVELIPSPGSYDNYSFILRKDKIILATYKYDPDKRNFHILENLIENRKYGNISPDQADEFFRGLEIE